MFVWKNVFIHGSCFYSLNIISPGVPPPLFTNRKNGEVPMVVVVVVVERGGRSLSELIAKEPIKNL
jgi:hypothetical protein